MNNKNIKKSLFIIIGLALVIFTVTGATHFIQKNFPRKDVEEKSANNEIKDWKTYRDEAFGFEFKYPAKILGMDASFQKSEWLKVENEILFKGKNSVLVVRPEHLSSYVFPRLDDSRMDSYDYALTLGVDIGGMGGYVYDPVRKVWFSRDDRNFSKQLSWNEFSQQWIKDRGVWDKDFPSMKIDGSHWALSGGFDMFESLASQYDVFFPEKDLHVKLSYRYSYCLPDCSENSPTRRNNAVVDAEAREMEKIMGEIVKTIAVIR